MAANTTLDADSGARTAAGAPPRVVRFVLGNITLVALVVGALVTAGLGLAVPALAGWQVALRGGLFLLFLIAASGRLGPPRAALVAMVPPRLPRPALLVGLTGALEVAGAVGLLLPMTYRLAAVCLGLLLIAVFPANVYAARHRVGLPTRLVPRTLEQVLYLAVAAAIAFA
ncbi:MAG TPA: DoxX family protein [Actinocatenispora sp.]